MDGQSSTRVKSSSVTALAAHSLEYAQAVRLLGPGVGGAKVSIRPEIVDGAVPLQVVQHVHARGYMLLIVANVLLIVANCC